MYYSEWQKFVKLVVHLYNIAMAEKQNIIGYFKNAIALDLLSQSYLLLGRGEEQMDLVAEIAPALVGDAGLKSPDLRIITPEDGFISIDEIRALRQWLVQSPITGTKKAAVIQSGQYMGEEAQNAFLKILEEPPAGTVIFILAGHPRQLLATIVSRAIPIYCHRQSRPAADEKEAAPWAEVLNAEPAERLQNWAELKYDKNKCRQWLASVLPQLRQRLVAEARQGRANANLLALTRTALQALSDPRGGHNWQLLCENLILNI